MAPPPPQYLVYGICIYQPGLTSPAMNILAAALAKKILGNVYFAAIEGTGGPEPSTAAIEQELDQAIFFGAIPFLIGHSLGAAMVVKECGRLGAKQPRPVMVPIAGVVDPPDWDGNTISNQQTVPGLWAISSNVGMVINPYSVSYPGGGHVIAAPDNSVTDIRQLYLPQYPHAAMAGYDIGSCPETQNAIIGNIISYLKASPIAPQLTFRP